MNGEQIKDFCNNIKSIIKDQKFSFGSLKYISADDAVSEISANLLLSVLISSFEHDVNATATNANNKLNFFILVLSF